MIEENKFYRYIHKVSYEQDNINLIDTKEKGAGLGIYKILYNSQTLICNFEKNKRTEMIAIVETETPIRKFQKNAAFSPLFRI